MPRDDQDEITFSADFLGIDAPLSEHVAQRPELAHEFQRDHGVSEARLTAYVGEDLEKALMKCAELQRATD